MNMNRNLPDSSLLTVAFGLAGKPVRALAMLCLAGGMLLGCQASERTTIPGGVVDEEPDGGNPGGGNPGGDIDTSEPEALEVVDFGETSGMSLAQVGHAEDMTNNPAMSRYVEIASVLQLTGAGGVEDGKIALSKLDDSGAETAVDADVIRSYDGGTAWILPKALLSPGTRYKLHVTKGAATETQAFRAQVDVGDIEAGKAVMLDGVTAALHLRAGAAVHPPAEGVGSAFVDALGLLLAAGEASVTLDGTSDPTGSVELSGFLSDDLDMDGAPDHEDLTAGTMLLTGQAHGHYVRLQALRDGAAILTVTGRLRAFDDGWRLMGGAALVNSSCDMFPSSEGQAACGGDSLVVVAPVKGETVYLSGLKVAAKARITGEGDDRAVLVDLAKPRWVADKGASAEALDLTDTVHAQVLAGGEVAVDSMDGAELVAQPQCGDDGCFLHSVGVVIGADALPAGVVTLKVTLGLQSAEVPAVQGGDDAE